MRAGAVPARASTSWWPRRELEKNWKKRRTQIRASGGEGADGELDLTSPESIKEAFASAQGLGRVDILVNNAGITRDGLAMRMKPDDWDVVLPTNLTGAFLASSRCCRR